MIPSQFTDSQTNPHNSEVFFNAQYPDSNDCNVLASQISAINKDISDSYQKEYSLVGPYNNYRVFLNSYRYLLNAKLAAKKVVKNNCKTTETSTTSAPVTSTKDLTVENATPNTSIPNSKPTSITPGIIGMNTNLQEMETSSNVDSSGVKKYLTKQNGLIAIGVLAIFAITYFATKKKTLPK